MGSVSKRIRDGKQSWVVRWREPDGTQRKKSFTLKRDADRHLALVDASIVTGDYVTPTSGKATVGEWAAVWLDATADLKPSTRARYEQLVRKHVVPRWGTVPLSKVTHDGVGAWVGQLVRDGYAPGTVRQAYRVLSLVLSHAVRSRRLTRNVAEGVGLPRATRATPRFLTMPEVRALAAAAGDDGVVVLVLSMTGARFGEVVALRVGRVDHVRRRLTIAESASEVGGVIEWGTPKTHAVRTVPFPRSLAEPLAVACVGKGSDDLVFTSPEGGALRLGNWRRRVFDPACKAAGITDLTPHDLRHTAASLAIASGASVKDVQRMLGHASAAMTLDVYAGLYDDGLDDVADRLDGLAPPERPGGPDEIENVALPGL